MTIDFKPNAKQFKAWEYLTDTVTTEIGYGGGASGGKSYLGCVWVVAMCLSNADTGYLIGRRELTTLKKTTIITLFKVLRDFKVSDKAYNYNQQNNTLTFTNGSQIFFMDLDSKPSDPLYTRFGGLELTGGFVDESNECPEEAISIIKTRLGRRGSLKPKLLETFNPSKNHVYKRFYLPFTKNTMPANRVFIPALATDNPHTSKDYIEQLKTSDPITRARLLEGNFEYDDDPNALIDNKAIYDMFTNTVDIQGKYLTADIARYGQDKTVLYCWRGLELYKTLYYEKQSLAVTAEKIRGVLAEEEIPYSHTVIDEDGVGGGVVDILVGVEGFVNNSKPLDVENNKQNFNNLKSQCYFRLAELINTHKIAVKIEDNYIKNALIEELQYVKRKDVDNDSKLAIISKDTVKEMLGRSPDFSDALMMRMYFDIKGYSSKGISIRVAPQFYNPEGDNTFDIRF